MTSQCSIRDSFANTEWDSLAHTMNVMKVDIEAKNAKTRRLRTRVGIVRMILYNKLKQFNGDDSIELSFFIASFKTIQKMEKEFDANHIKKREFLIFLKLLFYKLEKQKLNVKKPLAMLAEFNRMKGVVENGHSPL